MKPIDRMQFRHRLTGADFKPQARHWTSPVLAALLIFAGTYLLCR